MSTVVQFPLGSNSPVPAREDRDWITRAELVDAAGITYRQADYWTRTNLLHPLDDGHRGSGHRHRYRLDQIVRAAAIHELLDAGVSLATIRSHVDEYLTTGRIDLGHLTITRTHPKEHRPA